MVSGRQIVLGVSGSIAAYKAVYLLRLLSEAGAEVTPVLTRGAARFVGPLSFSALAGRRAIVDLWSHAEAGEIGHVEVAARAEALVLAPATADLLNRLVAGRADDPLCAIALSTRAPWVVAPAMETGMWNHPATQSSVQALRDRGALIVAPEEGALASGRDGSGRLAEPETIFEATAAVLTPQDLAGKRILVTAGPTREHLDPARFLSNPSSGKMGFALARVARRRGAEVILVSGPTALPAPAGVQVIRVETTRQMLEACQQHLSGADALIMGAAPADYTPAHYSAAKLKKDGGGGMEIAFESTEDILSALGARQNGRVVVGFAAESDNVITNARKKLEKKNLDLVVANDITRPDAGFGADTNAVTIIGRDDAVVEVSVASKDEVARRILDQVIRLQKA